MPVGMREDAARGDLLLGVDGGGLTTQAVIANLNGDVLGRGLGPPSNHHRVGIESACQALRTAIEGAFAQVSGMRTMAERSASWAQTGGISAAYLGLAGVDSAQDEALFSAWLMRQGVTFKYAIGNDSNLILGGGTPEGWGVALISGTGSICVGRAKGGPMLRVGGWGHVLGDEGSGYEIATDGLKLATQAADGRGGSPALLAAALAHWRLKEPKELLTAIARHETTAEEIAEFAVRVLELSGRNDPAARTLVERAAQALALHVDTVVQKLGVQTPPLALGGPMMRITLKRLLLEKIQTPLGPVAVVNDPVQGAVANARRMLYPAAAIA
jgi:N-acetylglucosamine kinase-like BadF-type ATPase